MLIIVTYDVATNTQKGRKRLRQMAKLCESMGQRVQKSVFECQINEVQFEKLERDLLKIIDKKEDCLRLYRLHEPVDLNIKEYGKFKKIDFTNPLII